MQLVTWHVVSGEMRRFGQARCPTTHAPSSSPMQRSRPGATRMAGQEQGLGMVQGARTGQRPNSAFLSRVGRVDQHASGLQVFKGEWKQHGGGGGMARRRACRTAGRVLKAWADTMALCISGAVQKAGCAGRKGCDTSPCVPHHPCTLHASNATLSNHVGITCKNGAGVGCPGRRAGL